MTRRSVVSLLALFAAVLFSAACGGPSSPSGEGVVLQGTLVGDGVASASAASGRTAAAAVITVTVAENPAITATVGGDGRFSLRGLPEGGFTLVFMSDGVKLGTIAFAEVKPNQEITITVRVDGSTVVVVEERRNGIGHGDVEIEGRVDSVSSLNPAGDSVFVIDGHTVVVRPGATAIREGNRARSVEEVTVGRQVHVKGVWLAADRGTQSVLAHEIKLQGGEENGGGTNPTRSCAAGSNAEVEGLITAKGGSSVTVTQQAKGDYLCLVSASTRIRKGNTTFTFAQLQPGWRVHVKGTQQGMAGSACQVNASEVKVQNQ